MAGLPPRATINSDGNIHEVEHHLTGHQKLKALRTLSRLAAMSRVAVGLQSEFVCTRPQLNSPRTWPPGQFCPRSLNIDMQNSPQPESNQSHGNYSVVKASPQREDEVQCHFQFPMGVYIKWVYTSNVPCTSILPLHTVGQQLVSCTNCTLYSIVKAKRLRKSHCTQ